MNKLILVSGHSGSGKSTIMSSLMDNMLISFTTRPMREGEVEGKDYYFITEEEYREMFDSGQLAEYTKYGGNYYGLTKEEIDKKLTKGHAFAIVDYVGIQQLSEIYDNCVSIILHTTKEDAVRQMRERGDSEQSIKQRMTTYEEEISNKKYYDYAVVNRYGKFENTKKIIKSIISAETNV